MKVLSAAEMRAVDARAAAELGIPVAALMENAGRAVADALEEELPGGEDVPILIACGRGNNGGDGLVAARHLWCRGHQRLQVVLLARIGELRSDLVRGHAEAVQRLGIPLVEAADEPALAAAELDFTGFPAIVDAVFGTGFRPPARGVEARAIEAMAEAGEAGSFVLAVDLPSGLDADTGRIEGPAVAADRTVALAAPKPAHFLPPAEERIGRLTVAGITIPPELLEAAGHRLEWLDLEAARPLLAPRSPGAHKGTFGHLLVVAGSRGKSGAAVLAARAALRSGVGLVTVATAASSQPIVAASLPEAMTEPLVETAGGAIAEAALDRLLELGAEREALAIGPGLGTDPSTVALVRALLARLRVPAVVDADALNAFAGSPASLAPAPGPRVLTPHPGEAARLLGRKASEIDLDRLEAARELAGATGAVVVLKGRRTVTAAPDGRAWLNSTGNPGLATGGTGDVLTGVVGALLARGFEPAQGAAFGAFLHGLAGDLAAQRLGQEALIAGDVTEALPRAWRRLDGEGGAGEPGS